MSETRQRVRRRPALFRALGRDEPPETVTIGDTVYRREQIFKHDSWAATARYAAADGRQVACKFNRRQSICGLPAAWIGRRLAHREMSIVRLMADVDGFPRDPGPVLIDGVEWPHVAAHEWLPGAPFHPSGEFDDEFFPTLLRLVETLHARDVAYVDLGKAENILVGDDGKPYLVDFQIHYRYLPWKTSRWICRALQQTDLYHVHKHWSRGRPDQWRALGVDLDAYRPWVTRLAHRIQPYLRGFRRRLLIAARVRTGEGKATTETEPEEAVRRQLARRAEGDAKE